MQWGKIDFCVSERLSDGDDRAEREMCVCLRWILGKSVFVVIHWRVSVRENNGKC